MKRFKIFQLELDGTRKSSEPSHQYDREEAQPNQPEWGKLEEWKFESFCSPGEIANALEMREDTQQGITFKQYLVRPTYEVEVVDLDTTDNEDGYQYQKMLYDIELSKKIPPYHEFIKAYLAGDDAKLQTLKDDHVAAKAQLVEPVLSIAADVVPSQE